MPPLFSPPPPLLLLSAPPYDMRAMLSDFSRTTCKRGGNKKQQCNSVH
jgi:hypothetical protein